MQDADTGAGNSSNDALATFYYVAQPGDPAGPWTFTINSTGGNDWGSGILYEITGQDATTPVNQAAAAAYGGGTNPFTTSSVTPSVLNCLALSGLTTDGPQTVSSLSSGWLLDQAAATGYHSSYGAHRRLLTADTSTAISNAFTLGGTDAGSSEILLIAPASAATIQGAATLAGQGLLGSPDSTLSAAATLAGHGALATASAAAAPATLAGQGALGQPGSTLGATAAITGQGAISTAAAIRAAATMTGQGSLTTPAVTQPAALTLTGKLPWASPPRHDRNRDGTGRSRAAHRRRRGDLPVRLRVRHRPARRGSVRRRRARRGRIRHRRARDGQRGVRHVTRITAARPVILTADGRNKRNRCSSSARSTWPPSTSTTPPGS